MIRTGINRGLAWRVIQCYAIKINGHCGNSYYVSLTEAIKLFSWIATMWGASILLNPAMFFTYGFLFLFALGGLTGLMQLYLSTCDALILTGLSGMPRRIPSYPDAWLEANLFSSLGSIMSMVASFLFFSFFFADLREINLLCEAWPFSTTTWLFSITSTASLIPDQGEMPLFQHSTLETFLYSPLPFHSTKESPCAYLING